MVWIQTTKPSRYVRVKTVLPSGSLTVPIFPFPAPGSAFLVGTFLASRLLAGPSQVLVTVSDGTPLNDIVVAMGTITNWNIVDPGWAFSLETSGLTLSANVAPHGDLYVLMTGAVVPTADLSEFSQLPVQQLPSRQLSGIINY